MQSNPFDEELTFKDCLEFLIRNKKIIFIFSLIGLLLSFYYSSKSKSKWEGEMQIVLSGKAAPNLNNFSIFNPSKSTTELSTQLQILKSPSVLMPVYEFLNEEKLLLNSKYIKPSFKGWLESNLDIDLVESTSVLNLKYSDTNKSLVIPVLSKISEEYKRYPFKSNFNTREKQLKSLKKTIENAKLKSESSFSKAQEYGNKNNIYIINPINFSEIKKNLNLTTNIELDKANAKKKLNEIENKLSIIKNLDINKKGGELIISLLKNQTLNDLNSKLIENNDSLIRKQLHLRPNDIEIINLKKLIYSQKSNMKTTAIEILEGEKAQQQELINEAISQKDKVYEFKRLYKNSAKDDELLSILEKENLSLELIKLSVRDPWEIISKPTLYDVPKNNYEKIFIQNTAIFILLGLFLSITLELYKDKVYDNKSLSAILKNKLITKIKKDSKTSWDRELEFIQLKIKESGKMSFIISDENENNYIKFKKIVEEFFIKENIIISNNLNDIYKLPNPFLFISEGITNLKNVREIISKTYGNNESEISFILLKK